jgi:hypothetical protein
MHLCMGVCVCVRICVPFCQRTVRLICNLFLVCLALLGRPRRLRPWTPETTAAGEEKLPILPEPTNSGDRYWGDE